MFNGHIADKRLQQALKTEEIKRKENQIRKRYHTEIQPLLLAHYQKRLRSFIQKMNTDPIIVNPQNLLPPIKYEPHFTFRDASDWRRLAPHYQPQESQEKAKLNNSKQPVYRLQTLHSETYSVCKHEFRVRERQKELQPAMRFKSVEKARLSKKKQKKNSTLKQVSKRQSQQPKLRADSFNGLRETSISISNNSTNKVMDEEELQFLLNRERNDIELEARIYEKQREPNEKKFHFKKIAGLANTQKNQHQKKDLRQILRKSGYSKVKRINFLEIPETDNFSALVQKIANK